MAAVQQALQLAALFWLGNTYSNYKPTTTTSIAA